MNSKLEEIVEGLQAAINAKIVDLHDLTENLAGLVEEAYEEGYSDGEAAASE